MSRRRPTLKLGYKRLPAPSGPDDDALAELLDDPPAAPAQDRRKRASRAMPYSAKDHPEHDGAVSLARSASVATPWEFAELWRRHPEKLIDGFGEVLKLEGGSALAEFLKSWGAARRKERSGE